MRCSLRLLRRRRHHHHATSPSITGDVTTTKVYTTTYVCPTPGTYTINPITTTVTGTEGCDYPVISDYPPGIYTQPEFTITVTQTSQVVTCPYYKTSTVYIVPVKETSTPEPPKPETPKPETTKPVVKEEPPATTTEVPDVVEPTTSTVTKPSETPKTVVKKPLTKPGSGGGKWAITYSQYNDDQTCKDGADVENDIADIASKGFKAIRLYSSDCGALDTVGSSVLKHGLKVIGGVFIKAGGVSTAESQVDDWIKWDHWESVELFVVGNESLFQGFCTPEQLAAFIAEVKAKLQAHGYNGPVTTAEPLNVLQAHYGVLCDVIDVMGIHIHPFFNPDVSPPDAGNFLNAQLKDCDCKFDTSPPNIRYNMVY